MDGTREGDREELREGCTARDDCFINGGDMWHMSAAYDRYIKLWDTETGYQVEDKTEWIFVCETQSFHSTKNLSMPHPIWQHINIL